MSSLFRRTLIENRPLFWELNKTYGLNFAKSIQLLKKFGLHKNCKVSEVSHDVLDLMLKNIESHFLADIDLKKNYMANVRRRASFRNHHAIFLRIKLKKDNKDAR